MIAVRIADRARSYENRASPLQAIPVCEIAASRDQRAHHATDVFLRINGCRLNQSPAVVFARMMEMSDAGTFDIAHLEPCLRGMVRRAE
ncbi:MAG: hypothetical protein Q8Q80_18165 [Methyloversatilis sp.]|uniref:hypothetical protein n=1 Tax=Methyloversatilis sp. TaxID=2569862 RepID=UPI002733066A|nr:hypothetical protein [Methyloversatilis sp.]MDP3874589.1 hypothetical protein [Methyloversatilis sp.]